MKTVTVELISEERAREIMDLSLKSEIDKVIRRAHKAGARKRPAYAEHFFEGPLLNAAIRLPNEFEERVRGCVSEAWNVAFGYTVVHHAPGILLLRLK